MSRKQSLRLPINVAIGLCTYLRTASALAAQSRRDPTSANLQAFEHLLTSRERDRDTLQPEATSQAYD